MPAARTTRNASKTKARKSATAINFRLKVIYKSGITQDFLYTASNDTSFDNFRNAFQNALMANGPKGGTYTIGNNVKITIDWREVVAVQAWQD
jgi:hypothetical protein